MISIRTALLALVASFAALTASAHFNLNQNVRIFHVVHSEAGFDLFLRTPMPYLVAGEVGPIGFDDLPAPAPFTVNRFENGVPMHLVNVDSLRAAPDELARFAAEALLVVVDQRTLTPEVVSLRAYPIGLEPGFATQAEAEAALALGPAFPQAPGETYVGDTVVDIHLRFPSESAIQAYALSVTTNPGLPGQEKTANLILDHKDGQTRTYRAAGLLTEPVQVTGSATAAAATFVVEGVRHILEGLDHVLFVLCMIIGAASLRSLMTRVTGFTVGHTVTLIAGFFGLAPQGAWFVPVVESLIALSIIFAAADAVLRGAGTSTQPDRFGLFVTTGIGLLHGFGFSFVLQNILQVDAPNVWQSLLAFNVGVELGQLMVVAAIWPLVLILRSRTAIVWRATSGMVALSASVVSAIWVFERTSIFFT